MDGITGENFFKLLESRLDNVVYRMGLANTRRAARQLVNHGHILVNGKKVNIPSYQVKPGDKISIREKSMEHPVIKENLEKNNTRLAFVKWDDKTKTGEYVRFPERSELNAEVNELLIVEYYNR